MEGETAALKKQKPRETRVDMSTGMELAGAPPASGAEEVPTFEAVVEPSAATSLELATPKGKGTGKGFLLSARRAPAEDNVAAEEVDSPEPPSSPESPAKMTSPPLELNGKQRPKKRQGIGAKKKDGTPRKESSESVAEGGSPKTPKGKKGGADGMVSPSRDHGMISRRPGASNAFLGTSADLPPAEPAAADMVSEQASASEADAEKEAKAVAEEVDEAAPYGSVPATWVEANKEVLPAEEAHVQLKGEGNASLKGGRLSRVTQAMSRKGKKKQQNTFEARAKLAYYGTIGGGFGTPRLGFAPGQFNTPTWMSTTPSGTLVVSSTFAHEVQVLSPRGGPMAILNSFDGVPLHDPQGIAIDGDDLFIADGGNGRVLKFTNIRGHYKPNGATDAKMELPQGLAIDDTLLFVVCGRMNRVYVLDKRSLKRLFYFGSSDKGDTSVGALCDPTDIAVYTPPDGAAMGVFGGRARKLLYVSDTEADRVALFSMDGDFVSSIGQSGRQPGAFIEPLGISIRGEQVFVAEGGRGLGGRMQILKPDGAPLLVLPAPTAGRLVGIHWHDERLYCSEIEAHRLHSFKIVA